ncbi:methyltransferase domain-containing protein [Methylocapsa polymorpha]|uniref:Methyltransferase domain-containing protein n=1 Tax=Methylocapsa polymorpha TaxID=3080828 RepID=A0ABZ0HUD1_9HYPH|nr:methyltransferase domain-containing protein [Methylocapsa sp. RX1]
METPLCPVTGQPAVRRVQWVTTRLLTDLWRIEFGVDARSSFAGLDRFGLWESPVGLYFFEPRVEGDQAFYQSYYRRLKTYRVSVLEAPRAEFETAARMVEPGARVLDVSCGAALFQKYVPYARYTGIDPHFTSDDANIDVRRETLSDHLATHSGAYDVVCAFQVIEHLASPRPFFERMVAAAKPGGLVVVGVPHVPSAATRIPNFLLNAPPHHLTWWTRAALAALARDAGLSIESIAPMPWTEFDSLIYWIERCSPVKCGDKHFLGDWSWHAASAVGLLLGRVVHAVRRPPKVMGEGAGLLLIARRKPPMIPRASENIAGAKAAVPTDEA